MDQKQTYYNWENRLTQDACARQARELENESVLNYYSWNPLDCENMSKVKEFAFKHPNLRFRTGYGVADSCTIDDDSKTRMIPLTHGPEKRQMHIREFHAVPNLSHGCFAPVTESKLINGQNTSRLFTDCAILPEVDFNRFTPFTDCMRKFINGYSEYEEDARIGINTRELTRKKLKNCDK
jgi:hypothetical protein